MSIKMIITDIYELDDKGAADKVERIEGFYNGQSFELDRVYSDYNDDDETYGLIEVEWYIGDDSISEEEQTIIIERFWDMDYEEAAKEKEPIKMIIHSETYLGNENAHGAPEVRQIIGTYMESDFILNQIYDGQYKDEYGDTYYESYRFEMEEYPFDKEGNSVGAEIIVDRFNDGEYEWGSQPIQPQELKFNGNFGTLLLSIQSGGSASGQYQDGAVLKGNYKDGVFEGEWKNKGMEGLVKFTIAGNNLTGNWKKGLKPGAMKGKWNGELVKRGSSELETKKNAVAKTSSKDDLTPKIIETLISDLNQYQFYHIGPMLNHLIDDVGPEYVGKAIAQMIEGETHYNLQTGIKHLYDKWGNDDDYFAEHPNLTDHFIETYIETYNDRIPNLRKHIATKAKQNFGELGAVWSMKNGYSGYLVKDTEDWIQLKGPVGLAIRLCGCESFNQVVETEATKEFGQHFSNIFYFTLKEIEELPAQYRENLKAMLLTTIDSIYHVEEWNLGKADGILTQAIGALLRYEFGLDFNEYITENQVPVCYDGDDLALFGVSGVSDVEYPVDYSQMEADLLALVL